MLFHQIQRPVPVCQTADPRLPPHHNGTLADPSTHMTTTTTTSQIRLRVVTRRERTKADLQFRSSGASQCVRTSLIDFVSSPDHWTCSMVSGFSSLNEEKVSRSSQDDQHSWERETPSDVLWLDRYWSNEEGKQNRERKKGKSPAVTCRNLSINSPFNGFSIPWNSHRNIDWWNLEVRLDPLEQLVVDIDLLTLDIWVEIFLWCFMTSIVVYFIASILAIRALRSHKIGRWYAVLILLAGITTPMLSSALTSALTSFHRSSPTSRYLSSSLGALLSAMFYAASVEIRPFFCFVLGVGQTGVVLFFSFLKILSTLWTSHWWDSVKTLRLWRSRRLVSRANEINRGMFAEESKKEFPADQRSREYRRDLQSSSEEWLLWLSALLNTWEADGNEGTGSSRCFACHNPFALHSISFRRTSSSSHWSDYAEGHLQLGMFPQANSEDQPGWGFPWSVTRKSLPESICSSLWMGTRNWILWPALSRPMSSRSTWRTSKKKIGKLGETVGFDRNE